MPFAHNFKNGFGPFAFTGPRHLLMTTRFNNRTYACSMQDPGTFLMLDDPEAIDNDLEGNRIANFTYADTSDYVVRDGAGQLLGALAGQVPPGAPANETMGARGAVLEWDVDAAAGDVLRFAWAFLPYDQETQQNDFALVEVAGSAIYALAHARGTDKQVGSGWRVFDDHTFAVPFQGKVRIVVSNGQRNPPPGIAAQDVDDRHPSALLLAWITIAP